MRKEVHRKGYLFISGDRVCGPISTEFGNMPR